jgi:hypothetical protein
MNNGNDSKQNNVRRNLMTTFDALTDATRGMLLNIIRLEMPNLNEEEVLIEARRREQQRLAAELEQERRIREMLPFDQLGRHPSTEESDDDNATVVEPDSDASTVFEPNMWDGFLDE